MVAVVIQERTVVLNLDNVADRIMSHMANLVASDEE